SAGSIATTAPSSVPTSTTPSRPGASTWAPGRVGSAAASNASGGKSPGAQPSNRQVWASGRGGRAGPEGGASVVSSPPLLPLVVPSADGISGSSSRHAAASNPSSTNPILVPRARLRMPQRRG